MKDVCASFEIGGATAALQRDLLSGPVADVGDRIDAIQTAANRVTSLWSSDIGDLLEQAQARVSATAWPDTSVQAQLETQATLSGVRGVTAGTSHHILDGIYGDTWKSLVEPQATTLPAPDTATGLAGLASLAQRSVQLTDTLPTVPTPAVTPWGSPPAQPFKSLLDQALDACREGHASWAGEGSQPSAAAAGWLPAPSQTLHISAFGGGAAPAAPVKGPQAIQQAVLQAAKSQLGVPYREIPQWKANDHLDCSSLVVYAYSRAGIKLPRTSQEQWFKRYGHKIPLAQARPGDAIYFNNHSGGSQPGHTAVLAPNGQLIVASSGAGKVIYQPLSYWQKTHSIIGCKRFYGGG